MDLSSIDNGYAGKGLLFVISSVSGGGKTTVIQQLLNALPGVRLCVSHTTRRPRAGEAAGEDYHFVTEDVFDTMVGEGEFLEWARVYGHKYGTSKKAVDSITGDGFDAVLDIDVQGAMQVKDKRGDAVLIFITPPDAVEQERRLRSRATESEADVNARLEAAGEELAFVDEYHYSVLNADLNDAVDTVGSIIKAERCRVRIRKRGDAAGGRGSNETQDHGKCPG